jgi:hypothetical protein
VTGRELFPPCIFHGDTMQYEFTVEDNKQGYKVLIFKFEYGRAKYFWGPHNSEMSHCGFYIASGVGTFEEAKEIAGKHFKRKIMWLHKSLCKDFK